MERSGREASKKLQEIEAKKRELNHKEREIYKRREEAAVEFERTQRDLQKQKQKLSAEEQKIRYMQKKLDNSFSLPENWSSTERPPHGVRMVPLNQNSDLFKALSKFLLSEHIGRGGRDQLIPGKYFRLTLRCAWRIENPDLWRTYCAAKKRVMGLKAQGVAFPRLRCALDDASKGIGPVDTSVNETRLVHGTKPEVLESLLRNGVNERFSGTRCALASMPLAYLLFLFIAWTCFLQCSAGAAFGHGCYFAEDPASKLPAHQECVVPGCYVPTSSASCRELRQESYWCFFSESDQYVTPDHGEYQPNSSLHSMLFSKSHRHPNKRIFYILVCRVILGYGLKLPAKEVASSAFQPRNPRELKYIPEVNSPVFYNSLFVDRTRDHGFNEIVIFHSDQTFPEYLLAFTRD
jgi:hypothetical protein